MKKVSRKIVSFVLVLAMLLGLCGCGGGDAVSVYVSIAVAGEAQLAVEKVSVCDLDKDGALTLNDALLAVHKKYAANKAKDFASEDQGYGLAITKLWGDESGSYGYYLNNESVANLEAEIKAGDYIYAYSYSDLDAWSDSYTYFDKYIVNTDGGELTLQLFRAGYDESWNPVSAPYAGASVLVNGLNIGQTDSEGKVSFSAAVSGRGGVVVMAEAADGDTIVPALCLLVAE